MLIPVSCSAQSEPWRIQDSTDKICDRRGERDPLIEAQHVTAVQFETNCSVARSQKLLDFCINALNRGLRQIANPHIEDGSGRARQAFRYRPFEYRALTDTFNL